LPGRVNAPQAEPENVMVVIGLSPEIAADRMHFPIPVPARCRESIPAAQGSGLPPGEPVYVEPPPPRPVREAMTREAMLRQPPVPVERQRLESLIEDAGAPPLLPTPPPDAGPAFYPLPVLPSFELAAHAPPVPPLFEPVFQIPPVPEPKRMPAPRLPQRAAQDEESNLAEMAQRLEAALRRPIKPVEPVP
jgi:flagellar protein FliO/FliZ